MDRSSASGSRRDYHRVDESDRRRWRQDPGAERSSGYENQYQSRYNEHSNPYQSRRNDYPDRYQEEGYQDEDRYNSQSLANHRDYYRDQRDNRRAYPEEYYNYGDRYDDTNEYQNERYYADSYQGYEADKYQGYGDQNQEENVAGQHDDHYNEAPQRKEERPLQLRLVKLVSDVLPQDQRIAIVDGRSEGVSIGRDRSFTARIRCPSMEVSKHHANIFKIDAFFAVSDTGSTHGTYVLLDPSPSLTTDNLPPIKEYKRLSPAKKASVPEKLQHLSLLRVGQTVFQAHLHGGWTSCQDCALSEDGSNEILLLSTEKKEAKPQTTTAFQVEKEKMGQSKGSEVKVTPRQAIKQLKSRHLGEEEEQPEAENSQYVDRAAARRARGGVQVVVPPPQTASAINYRPPPAPQAATPVVSDPAAKLDESNRGYQMFASMSSKSGEKSLSNIDPISARGVEGRAGLGSKRLLDVQEMASRSYDTSQEGYHERQRRRFEEAS